ncbi:hypothetical protein H8D29_01995 [PVC group bacterium]|nr:hypothetical protein [PVC group bacterium]
MPICGLLITLDASEPIAEAGILQLSTDQRFTLGERVNPHLVPVILEANTPTEAQEATEWAQSIKGVLEVSVISVDYQTDPQKRAQGSIAHD